MGEQDRGALARSMAAEGSEAPLRRAERRPFGALEQSMAWPKVEGYRLYWFNDAPGRIQRAREAGYEHIIENGEPVTRIVGKDDGGRGQKAYLMKIPLEWYFEDRAAGQQTLDQRMSDIRNGRHGATAEQNQYVPASGIKITEERR